jgi:hypothetical protein
MQRHGDDQRENPTQGHENTIGDMLIGLPSVDFYCEASISGPLSMSNVQYKPLYPPKIATFHLNDGNLYEWFMVNDLPMIVGATNRYICATPFEIISPGHIPQAGEAIISRLLNLVDEGAIHIQQIKSDDRSAPGAVRFHRQEDEPNEGYLAGTTIEIYNWAVMQTHQSDIDNDEDDTHDTYDSTSRPLTAEMKDAIEAELDRYIGSWRRNMSVRNMADLPLCPACGIAEESTNYKTDRWHES